jgi:hypothetical protein
MASLPNLTNLVPCHMPMVGPYPAKRNHARQRRGHKTCSRVVTKRCIVAEDRPTGGQTDGKTISIHGGVRGKTSGFGYLLSLIGCAASSSSQNHLYIITCCIQGTGLSTLAIPYLPILALLFAFILYTLVLALPTYLYTYFTYVARDKQS